MGTAFRCNLVEDLIISEGVTAINPDAYNTQ
jgi:hypothetical protein